jgi:hypothetical protein
MMKVMMMMMMMMTSVGIMPDSIEYTSLVGHPTLRTTLYWRTKLFP